MDDNKTDQATEPIIPQDQQTPDLGYTNGDLKKESLRDIVANTELPKEPEVKEEPKVETPVEEPKPPVETPDPKVIAEEAAQAVLDKQKEDAAKVVEEPTKPEPKKEYQQIVDEFATKEGRPPTWDELAVKLEERSVERAIKAIEEKQETKRISEETAKQEAQARIEEETKRINTFVDDELSDAYSNGKLTPVKDPSNPSDQGVVERKALFATWKEVNDKRRAEGKPEIISATRIIDYYYKKPTAQPAGADVPIAGNRGSSTTPADEKTYSYSDLKKPWGFFGKKE